MFNLRIKDILEKQGKSQLQLSRETNIAPSDLNQVINGKKYCFPGWRKKIAKALKVKESELFNEE